MPDGLFHVKICGVTSAADARLVAESGADAIGLNFVAGSPRCLTVARGHEVAGAVPRGVLRVGVFAGGAADEILRIARAVGLDAIQLHGHLFATLAAVDAVDPPELVAALAGLPVIRAVRLEWGGAGTDTLAAARRWIDRALAAGAGPAMALVDAGVARGTEPGQLGGTGHTVDWPALAAAPPLPVPLGLAGGLTPGNVAAAIRSTAVRAVDTASGVEAAPGVKNAGKVRAFVAAARGAMGLGRG
jgi:phosphoribosylanthranilate isomerase